MNVAGPYVSALVREIKGWNLVRDSAAVDTIYFGGGTPSLLSLDQLEQILDAVYSQFEIASDAEITIEMNPGDARSRHGHLDGWRRLGINRVSFGAQTFNDESLRQLGRTHSAEDIRQTFIELRAAGFENINFDLIAGLCGQSLADWQFNLDEALKLCPEHLSLYLLDVHEGTPLADQIKRGMRALPSEDVTAEMYRVMIDEVCDAGYEHYEISNFCLPGHEAKHNSKYWTGAPYYGFGSSAHSYDGALRRWSNERDAARYTQLISADQSPVVENIELTASDAQAESMYLGLRLMRGMDVREFETRFGADPREKYQSDFERFTEAGLIEFDGNLIRLTRHGALLSNEVFMAFV